MKPATLIVYALAAFIPVLSTVAQDYDYSMGDEGEYEYGRDVDELRPGMDMEAFEGEDGNGDPPPSTRILGAAPAFGLGLLGGTVGSHLIRGVGSFLGLRSPPSLLRPPPAFYPAPYVPAGFPYPMFGPGRSGKPNKRFPAGEIPLTPYVPAIPVNYYRSEDGEQQDNDDDDDFNGNESF